MLQVYKILTSKDKVEGNQWFEMAATGEQQTRATAARMQIRIPANRLDVRKHFFSQRVQGAWNKVPEEIRRSTTTQAFKTAYKKHRREATAAST
jgi:hypothetical protein